MEEVIEELCEDVVDISDRKALMSRIVKEDAVKFVQIGTSGSNHCLTLSSAALLAIKSGSTFPVELIVGDQKVTFTIMRDTTFNANLRKFQKLNKLAKDTVDAQVEANEEVSKLGNKIGNNNESGKLIT